MSSSYKGASKSSKSCIDEDETTKKGACLLELRRSKMVKWGSCRQAEFICQNREIIIDEKEEENEHQLSSFIKEEHQDETGLETESILMPGNQESELYALSQPSKATAKRCRDQKKDGESSKCKKTKHEGFTPRKSESLKSRWGLDRYKLAEKHMLDVMKAEGAVFDNPITRPALRVAARKYIGDTGLLDHLLKHIDGKVAPGGTDRFRRCYNTEGIMEYWLERADLVKIKREAGVSDPNWVPPPCWKPGGIAHRDSNCAGELASLKEEIMMLKRNMEELASKKQEQEQASQIGEMYRELVKWRGKTDQPLTEISSSLSGLQNMYKELLTWKSKIEQQLVEVRNSLSSSIQATKQCSYLSPSSDMWEEWLEAGSLDNIQEEDITTWGEGSQLVNIRQDASVQEPFSALQPWSKLCDTPLHGSPVCARELELVKEEMAKMKRDMQELVQRRMEDDQTNMTPDSSTTANSKLEFDSSFLLFQEMFKDLTKWKAKMEQQMLDVSNSVSILQAQSNAQSKCSIGREKEC